jgi:hypothetical protein
MHWKTEEPQMTAGQARVVEAIADRWSAASPGPWYPWEAQPAGNLVYLQRIGPVQSAPGDPFGLRIASLGHHLACRRADLDALLHAHEDVAFLLRLLCGNDGTSGGAASAAEDEKRLNPTAAVRRLLPPTLPR